MSANRAGGGLLHYLINHIETPPRLLTAQGGGGGENSLHGTMWIIILKLHLHHIHLARPVAFLLLKSSLSRPFLNTFQCHVTIKIDVDGQKANGQMGGIIVILLI